MDDLLSLFVIGVLLLLVLIGLIKAESFYGIMGCLFLLCVVAYYVVYVY